MSDEVKPERCPCCKGSAELCSRLEAGLTNRRRLYWVVCSRCSLQTILYLEPRHALDVWNSRPIESAQAARIEELEDFGKTTSALCETLIKLNAAGLSRLSGETVETTRRLIRQSKALGIGGE